MTLIVLTMDNCAPCKQLYNYLEAINHDFQVDFIYNHSRPDLFQALGVKTVPTLIEELTPKEYKIIAIGLPEIMNYFATKDKSEEEE